MIFKPKYFFGETFSNFRKNFLMFFTAITTIAITLFIVGFFIILVFDIQDVGVRFYTFMPFFTIRHLIAQKLRLMLGKLIAVSMVGVFLATRDIIGDRYGANDKIGLTQDASEWMVL